MNTLRDNIKLVKLLTAESMSSTTSGTGVDCHGTAPENFDSALVFVNVGAITGSPTSVKVKIEESDDDSTFTTASGGTEVTVAASTQYTFQVNRTKRYIRATVTITGGTSPTVIVASDAVLNKWATPYPTV